MWVISKAITSITSIRHEDALVEQDSVSQSISRMTPEKNKAWVSEEPVRVLL